MREREKTHIIQNLSQLVNKTSWRTSCITVPIENGVFGDDDVAVLESIPNERKRILEFYQLFMKKHNSYQHLITTLEASYQSGAVKILNGLKEENDSSSVELESSEPEKDLPTANPPDAEAISNKNLPSVHFDILPPVPLFTGRKKELENLHEKLHQSKTNRTVISRMVSIVGLGGIGKTELARAYIHQYAEEYYDNNVIWISAQSEETLTESVRRLATDYLKLSLLNVDGKEKHMPTIIDEVYNYFKGKQSLFVFDNAENNDKIQNFMPFRVSNRPHILITSKDKEWSFSIEILELNEMEEKESIEFVKNCLQIQNDKQEELVMQLVETLQCFPLALSQAISYIKQRQLIRNYSICEFLEEYASSSEKLLGCNIPSFLVNNYTKTTFTTWKMTTESISLDKDCGKEAIRMLNMISYFQPDKIPTKLLLLSNIKETSWFLKVFSGFNKVPSVSHGNSCDANEKALHSLVKYSMINIQAKEQIISIHRLVQEVTRTELRRQNLEEKSLRHALEILAKTQDFNSLLQFANVYKYCKTYKKLFNDFKSVPWRKLHSLTKSDAKCNPVSTFRIASELKEILQENVPSNDPDVIRLELQLAISNYRLGNFELAIKSFEEFLPMYLENKRGFKCSKNEILNIQYFYALCLRRLQKQVESLKILLKLWEDAKSLHGSNYWWTLEVLVNIANCLQELGYFNKPLEPNSNYLQGLNLKPNFSVEILALLKEAYETNKYLISTNEKFPSVIFAIANFFMKVGDHETARYIAEYCYEQGINCDNKRIQTYSVRCLNLLGVLKGKEGRQEEAREIFEQVNNFNSKMEEENYYVHTFMFKTSMLNSLVNIGEHEKALEDYRQVLETFKKSYPNSPKLYKMEYSVGAILFNLKRYEESLTLLIDLKKRIQERFGQSEALLVDVNKLIEKLKTK